VIRLFLKADIGSIDSKTILYGIYSTLLIMISLSHFFDCLKFSSGLPTLKQVFAMGL
jgi:hypothetical protein